MHTIEVSGKNTRIEVPDHWNEMTADQIAHIFKMYELLSHEKITIEKFKMRLLFYFVPIRFTFKRALLRRLGALDEVAESAVWLYDQLFDYVVKIDGNKIELNYDSPIQFFPTLYGTNSYGTLLGGMTMGRFLDSIGSLSVLDECGDDFFLGLYPGITPKQLLPWQKSWIMLWFKSCLVHIQSQPVLIDGREVDFSPIFSGGSGSGRGSYIDPWRGVMFSVAESSVFGSMESLRDAELFDVLMYLLKTHNDAKNIKY